MHLALSQALLRPLLITSDPVDRLPLMGKQVTRVMTVSKTERETENHSNWITLLQPSMERERDRETEDEMRVSPPHQ